MQTIETRIWNIAFYFIVIISFIIIVYFIFLKIDGCAYGSGFLSKLEYQISKDGVHLLHLFAGLGALLSLVLFWFRNRAFDKQAENTEQQLNDNRKNFESQLEHDRQNLKSQLEHNRDEFKLDISFKGFVEAASLASKDDAISQILAASLFYDYAQKFHQQTEVALNVLNKMSLPLFQAIDAEAIDLFYSKNKGEDYFSFIESNKEEIENKLTFDPAEKLFQDSRGDLELKKYKVVRVALEQMKKIIVDCLQRNDSDLRITLSNTVVFNIDIEVDFGQQNTTQKIVFPSAIKSISNSIFLHCNLKNAHFENLKVVGCSFINCNLSGCHFEGANLWGTAFIRTNLKNAKFEQAAGEAMHVSFAENFKIEQLNKINFPKWEDEPDKPIICDKKIGDLQPRIDFFESFKDYDETKNRKSQDQ